jgi:hypothetical protein
MAKHSKETDEMRFIKLLLTLALLCRIAASVNAQTKVAIATVNTGRVLNVETDVKVTDAAFPSGRGAVPWLNTADVAAHNLAVFNAALANYPTSSNGLTGDAVYIPKKTYYSNPGWQIRQIGGQILTGGGLTYPIEEAQRGTLTAGVTNVVFVGGSASTPCIEYMGMGWTIGPINFIAFPIQTNTDWSNALAGAFGVTRDIGLLEHHDAGYPGLATGSLHSRGVSFFGFKTAVDISKTPANDNCDKNQFDDLIVTGAGIKGGDTWQAIYCDNDQSVSNFVSHASLFNKLDYGFHFSGGDISWGPVNFDASGCHFLCLENGGPNAAWFSGGPIRVDNHAIPGFALLELKSNLVFAYVNMFGEINNNHALGGYVDSEVITNGVPVNDQPSSRARIQLNFLGMSPATTAAYPR